MKKEGQESPDYEVAWEFRIDEDRMSEEEIRLIESVIPDIIRMVLDNEEIGGE